MTVHPSEGGTHWYDKDGKPRYQIEGANGKTRPTTLRDARKHGYLPSVTSIIRLAAAPGLERWKQQQVLHAALTLPKIEGEPEESYLDRIMRDAQEQGKKAAERGTAIHAALEAYFEGIPISLEYALYTETVDEAIEQWAPEEKWVAEESFSHPLGFGGKCDLHSTLCSHVPFVLDFKTTEKDLEGIKTWPEHAWQLAAYREGLGMPNARCAIVYVHVASAEAKVIELSQEELQQGWSCFKALLAFHQAKTGYKP